MLNPLKLMKLKNAGSSEELFELLAAAGIDAKFAPIPAGGEAGAIREMAARPGARFFRLDVAGEVPMSAFVVFSDKQ